MESSASDTENECFESAEESLDENDELEFKNINSKECLCDIESEIPKPVFSDTYTTDYSFQLQENISNNLLSYRKRPERVKRSFSKSSTKSISKSPTNDAIFNADRVVPDVSFQDITSNLSKNINKSLSTLQQTSCNVKDLILSSLPVSLTSDSEGFSYDDKKVSSTLIKSDSQGELNFQFNNNSNNFPNITEKVIKNKEKSFEGESASIQAIENSSASRLSNDTFVETPCMTDNLEKKSSNFKETTVHDIVEQEINNVNEKINSRESGSACSSPDYLSKVAGGKCQENMKNVLENTKENLKDSCKTYLSNSNSEILNDQKETNKEINEVNTINILINTNQRGVEDFCNVEEVGIKIMKPLDEELDPLQEKNLGSFITEKLNHDVNNSLYLQTEDNESLASNDIDNFTLLSEGKSKVDSKCSLEELKMALESIVKEEKSSSKILKFDTSNKFLEENSSFEEKTSGWDDFDFSDIEDEDINQHKGEINIEKEQKNLNNEQLEENQVKVAQLKSLSDSKETENKAEDAILHLKNQQKNKSSVSAKEPATKIQKNTNLVTKVKNNKLEKNHEEHEKPIQPIKLKLVSDDSWDWENWGEIYESEEKVEIVPNKILKSKKTEDDFFDVSKWSGWDTFGQKPQEKQGNPWNLGSWGVDMLLNKATAVTQGISNVIEAGLGAPDPETLLRLEKEEREKLREQEREKTEAEKEEPLSDSFKVNSLTNVSLFPVSGITNLVAGVTSKIVEHSKIQEIGSKVITGGLDTLETFGKKTMEVLQEGDPGLKNKRALLLGNNKPVLSQVLREAREKAEEEIKRAEEKEMAKKCHFETLFDDFQGMVHLEALEMLSRQSELKLDQIKIGMNSEELEDLNGILEEVEQLCALDDYDIDMKSSMLDFKTALQMAVEPLKNEISIQKIIQILEDTNKWLTVASETKPSIILINQKLVSTLAELTAATVHQFHKSGELLSVKECRKTVEEVDALSKLTNVLCKEINRLCEKFLLLSHSTSYTDNTSKNSLNEKVAIVVKNSTLYIRQAFDLLIPVIQLGAAV